MKRVLILGLLLCLAQLIHAQQRTIADADVDVLHYTFSIELSDASDTIEGRAIIEMVALKDISSVTLDLASADKVSGKGMVVTDVLPVLKKQNYGFSQEGQKLVIHTVRVNKGDSLKILVEYRGIPSDGLIISTNKYGHRSFFSDNWPNRAHKWLPCMDIPSDKASVEFIVTAPAHYQVVSNGIQVAEISMEKNRRRSHWKEDGVIPTKVMVIGVADFAVGYAGQVDCTPVYSWVYPEEQIHGFYDYALATEILPFFIKNVGPYPYKKLANVQSKTIFGGMENAGAIFYHENSIDGKRTEEPLLAHEIAHQWFGNTATEMSFGHLWLSEGFATYMTHLYLESKYGKGRLKARLKDDRDKVVAFSKNRKTPVADPAETDYMALLNPNSYEKGGWILHMLRCQLGDSVFWKGVRLYYNRFKWKNAVTEDLQKAMEEVSGKNLETFFRQWVYRAGQPKLDIKWKYNQQTGKLIITVQQLQDQLFNISLELEVEADGQRIPLVIGIMDKTTAVEKPMKRRPERVIADPNICLLYEGQVVESK